MNRRILTFLVCTALTGAGCEPQHRLQPPTESSVGDVVTTSTSSAPGFIETSAFIRPQSSDQAWKSARARSGVCAVGRAGIVNHHAPAAELIAEFFHELARCRTDVKRIIVISPDHFAASDGLATHDVPYREEARVVATVAATPAQLAEGAFHREHGVGILMPFVMRSFPDATIVPLMLDQRVRTEELGPLEAWLVEMLRDPATFIVVSADFSHYRSQSEAEQRDRESLAALERSDADFFRTAGDSHTDSGKTISTVLEVLGTTEWSLLDRANSAEFAGGNANTTGYITGFWKELSEF